MEHPAETKLKPAAWFLIVLVVLALIALGLYSGRQWLFPEGGKDGEITKADLPGGGQVEAFFLHAFLSIPVRGGKDAGTR